VTTAEPLASASRSSKPQRAAVAGSRRPASTSAGGALEASIARPCSGHCDVSCQSIALRVIIRHLERHALESVEAGFPIEAAVGLLSAAGACRGANDENRTRDPMRTHDPRVAGGPALVSMSSGEDCSFEPLLATRYYLPSISWSATPKQRPGSEPPHPTASPQPPERAPSPAPSRPRWVRFNSPRIRDDVPGSATSTTVGTLMLASKRCRPSEPFCRAATELDRISVVVGVQ
jgi:hypothetical protein